MDQEILEDQAVAIKDTMIYQDNVSSILLEKNGKQSSTKRMKHMDTQYFYITERIQNKAFAAKHCPTEDILADFFMKLLQGSPFIKSHNFIMGAEFANGDQHTCRSVLDEDENNLEEDLEPAWKVRKWKQRTTYMNPQEYNFLSKNAWIDSQENTVKSR